MLCLYNLRGLLFKDSIDYSYVWFDIVLFIALMFHFWIQYTIWIYIVAYNPKWSSKLSLLFFAPFIINSHRIQYFTSRLVAVDLYMILYSTYCFYATIHRKSIFYRCMGILRKSFGVLSIPIVPFTELMLFDILVPRAPQASRAVMLTTANSFLPNSWLGLLY